MTSAPFGEHLKREREMRGVSLEEISAATRISTRFLAALENEQWDQLPGGVFNRGFIRSVARFLGLDEESLVSEYALETKNPAGPSAVVLPAPARRHVHWGAVANLILLATILAAGWFLYPREAVLLHRRPAATVAADAPPTARPATNDEAAPAKILPPDSLPGNVLELKMEAGKPADVKVVADGRVVFNGHAGAGEVERFTAHATLEISSSDSSAVFLELNGQTLPPIGRPGETGSVTLTRKDLKSPAGGPH